MAASIIKGNSFLKFKIELIDAETEETLGKLEDIKIEQSDLLKNESATYQVTTNGIGERTVKLKLTVKDNFEAKYSLVNRAASKNMILKSNPRQVTYNGEMTVKDYALLQNYPNPFNPVTTISYQLPEDGMVKLIVYDLLGNEIETLVNQYQNKGIYEIKFDASALASGMYLYRFTAGNNVIIKKMLLLK